jgi:hypothetical protein
LYHPIPFSLFSISAFLFFPSFPSTSPNPRHITNLTQSSNRTIDYLTESAAKPEAYQAHYRRISATKAANQKQQQAAKQQEAKHEPKQEQESKETALQKQQQQAMNADLFGFSVNFGAQHPKFNGPFPASAPAAFASMDEHAAVVQGEIPIGVELPLPSLPLSPMRDLELGC